MNKRTIILLIILLLAVLLKLSFWADQRAFEVQGVVRMLLHQDGTLFLLTNDEIIHASPDGDILSTWPLAGMGITEPVADLAFGLEGQLLVGLIESQEIRRYSSDGKFVGTVPRPASPERVGVPGQHLRNFKFVRDERTGTLYVADSNHHRIQIYPSGGHEARILTAPSGAPPSVEDEEGMERPRAGPEMDPQRPFRYPNSLAIDGDRIYATDTDNHRIIVFRLDGTLDRIIPTALAARNLNTFPVHFARQDDKLFVINRGPMFVGGEVVVLGLESPGSRLLYSPGLPVDPLDLVVMGDDVLIADGETRNILRYSAGGYYLGFFGKPALREFLRGKERAYRGYLLLRVLSIGGMAIVLIALLVLKRSERQELAERGLPDVHRPLPVLQEFLGPVGSRRRTALHWLAPGLGYIAAGRLLRAIILLPPLGFLVLLFLFAAVTQRGQGPAFVAVMVFLGIITGAYWSGVVLDGMRFDEGEPRLKRTLGLLDVLKTGGLPLITVIAGVVSQFAWELVKRAAPEIPQALQGMVGGLMLLLGLTNEHMAPFAAASVVGRFVGWGGAVAGMFGAVSWSLGEEQGRIVRAAIIGSLVGTLSWLFTAAVPGLMLGGAFYEPLSQGLLVGSAVYLLFRGPFVDLRVLVLAVAAAWTGNLVHLFLRVPTRAFFLPGASARILSIVVEAYFIHLAVQVLVRTRTVRLGTAADAE